MILEHEAVKVRSGNCLHCFPEGQNFHSMRMKPVSGATILCK